MRLFALLLALPLCAACGPNDVSGQKVDASDEPAPTGGTAVPADDEAFGRRMMTSEDPQAATTFAGSVAGFGLSTVDTVFVEGVVDMGVAAPVLVVVQSSAPDLCAHLQAGTYPKNQTFFPIALIQADGRPIAAHRTYKPSNPDDSATDNYFAFAQLRAFDQTCRIQPAAEKGMAVLGEVVFDHYARGEHVSGRYQFKMGQARDAVQGTFNATFCDAPKLFDDYMNLLNPSIDSAHCLEAVPQP